MVGTSFIGSLLYTMRLSFNHFIFLSCDISLLLIISYNLLSSSIISILTFSHLPPVISSLTKKSIRDNHLRFILSCTVHMPSRLPAPVTLTFTPNVRPLASKSLDTAIHLCFCGLPRSIILLLAVMCGVLSVCSGVA